MHRYRSATSATAIALGVLLASVSLLAGVEPTPFRTGYFGVAEGQTIRVSVFNARFDRRELLGPCAVPDALVATVVIRDLQGRALSRGRSGPVADGTGDFVDFAPLPGAGAPSAAGARTPGRPVPAARQRLQVRAEVVVASADAGATPREPARRRCRDEVMLTLEVFNTASGRTAFTLPLNEVAFNPQPEPPGPDVVR
jgi:hypothetical protein